MVDTGGSQGPLNAGKRAQGHQFPRARSQVQLHQVKFTLPLGVVDSEYDGPRATVGVNARDLALTKGGVHHGAQ